MEAYETLQKIKNSDLKDKSLIKYLLLKAHILFQLNDLDESKKLFLTSIKEIEKASRINSDEKHYLFEYIKQHFVDILEEKTERMYNFNKVDLNLKNTFPLNNA